MIDDFLRLGQPQLRIYFKFSMDMDIYRVWAVQHVPQIGVLNIICRGFKMMRINPTSDE